LPQTRVLAIISEFYAVVGASVSCSDYPFRKTSLSRFWNNNYLHQWCFHTTRNVYIFRFL